MKIFKKIAIYYLISALLISSAVSSAPRASAAPELTLNGSLFGKSRRKDVSREPY